ncbi:hypothetical protein CerSpe_117660 [Prunus speciosa]
MDSIKLSSATKLPVKRKNPDPIPNPNPNPNPNLLPPTLESTAIYDYNAVVFSAEDGQRTPPFKYHRIWTEPDELLFLQGLLDCASDGFSFPKDLHLFYARFSTTVSQHYTKSQLSEKLRRFRKKFRVVSARLARGLHESQLSPHDRALYDLSRKIWSSECWSTSPFGNKAKSDEGDDNLMVNQNQSVLDDLFVENDYGDEVKMINLSRPIAGLAAKTVLDVFDQSLNEVRMVLVQHFLLCPDHVGSVSGLGSGSGSCSSNEGKTALDFERQWQLQRLAELDVLSQRLRLVLDNTIRGQ